MEQFVFNALYGVEVGMAVYDVVPLTEKKFIEIAKTIFSPNHLPFEQDNNSLIGVTTLKYAKIATDYLEKEFPEFDKNPSKYLQWLAEIQRNLMLRLFNQDYFIEHGIELYGDAFFDIAISSFWDFKFLIPNFNSDTYFSDVTEFITRQKERYLKKEKIFTNIPVQAINTTDNVIKWTGKKEVLNRLCKELKRRNTIPAISDFKNLFNNKKDTRGRWNGDIQFLVYLLYALYDSKHLITTHKGKKHMKIAQQYFTFCDSRNNFSTRNDFSKVLNNVVNRSSKKYAKLRQDVDSMLNTIINSVTP